jgi:hypothetical protein
MARPGRKRKPGPRFPCGQRVQPHKERGENPDKVVAQVMAQPHRRGSKDPRNQWNESPLGRLCLLHRLRTELFDAGEAWAQTRSVWLSIVGAPKIKAGEKIYGSGRDVAFSEANRLRRLYLQGAEAIRSVVGEDGLRAIVRLACDRQEIHPFTPVEIVIDGLMALAIDAGKLRPSDWPVAPEAPEGKPRVRRAPAQRPPLQRLELPIAAE